MPVSARNYQAFQYTLLHTFKSHLLTQSVTLSVILYRTIGDFVVFLDY